MRPSCGVTNESSSAVPCSSLLVSAWNCRSASAKLPFISQYFYDSQLDVLALNETWHAESVPGKLDTFSAMLDDYMVAEELHVSVLSKARITGQRGGGVAIIFRKDLKMSLLNINISSPISFEYVAGTLKGNSNIRIITIYRPPSVSFSIFIDEFQEFVLALQDSSTPWLIIGDFNIRINETTNHNTVSFVSVLFENNCRLIAPVQASHQGGNTLDFAVASDNFPQCEPPAVDVSVTVSDHYPIHLRIQQVILPPGRTGFCSMKWRRNYRNMDHEAFSSDLKSTLRPLLTSGDVRFPHYLADFNSKVNNTLDDHAPFLSFKCSEGSSPWVDSEYRAAKALRNRLQKRSNHSAYNAQKRLCTRLLTEKRSNYYSHLFDSTDHSQIFKVVNKIIGKNIHKGTLPSNSANHKDLADRFNNFFVRKIANTRESIPSVTRDPLEYCSGAPESVNVLDSFEPTSAEELKMIISQHGVKTGPGDPLPPFLLKENIDALMPHFVKLVNLSLSNASCDGIKEAHVVPILKSFKLDADEFKSYRPVSLLSFISKLVERVVHHRINAHLLENNLMSPSQHGYKKHHSCETMLIKLIDDIMIGVNDKSGVVVLIVDLSAAFDTVDHRILLNILSYKYKIRGSALQWIKAFLSGRFQRVKINGELSDLVAIEFGVPQGSILGPLLFNMYCSSIDCAFEAAGFNCSGYADDNLGLRYFPAFSSLSTLFSVVPNCIQSVNDWADAHFLKLNRDKTELMIFGDSNFRSTFNFNSFRCNFGTRIPISSSIKLLGCHIDSDLTFDSQVSHMVSSINFAIRNLKPVRKFLKQKDAETITHALVTSKLDQCNSLLIGASKQNIAKLQRAQNSAIRYVCKLGSRTSLSNYYNELHWLTVEKRIYYKFLLVTYKCINNRAPILLMSKLHLLCPQDMILDTTVFRPSSAIGRRAFSYLAPRLWNGLPRDLRIEPDLELFKAYLKTFLYNNFQSYVHNVNPYTTFAITQ